MSTNVQRCTDITAVPTIRRATRNRHDPERNRYAVLNELADIEWLMPTCTAAEVAARIGRSSPAALVRFLIRAERWDLAIQVMPIPLDPRDAYRNEEMLEAARWRVVTARLDLIGWVLAWNTTRPAPASAQLAA